MKDRLSRLWNHSSLPVALLLLATVMALVWANSPCADSYRALVDLPLGVSFGNAALKKPLLLWVNDGLMGIFFFLVGLEIKREVLVGELASLRKASLSVAAAIGGMLVPALLYFAVQRGGEPAHAMGWGIPMATDIAFALGLLSLLGSRVPPSLRIFLTALAIVDDIGAVLVIAIFYTDTIALGTLAIGLGLFGVAILANRRGVRTPLLYFLLGTLVWLAFLKSGVHATVAALLMAFTIPARTRIDRDGFREDVQRSMERLASLPPRDHERLPSAEEQRVLDRVAKRLEHVQAPLQTLEHQLYPLVKRIVLPVFALANAGVAIDGHLGEALAHPVALGISFGLVVGKPLGVFTFSFLAVKLKLAELPKGATLRHLLGVGLLAGVGFTMALFIAGLAFDDPALADVSKVGILAGSVVAALLGLGVLAMGKREGADAKAA
ncbi:MAG: Na+/H+ antiporter NhaA [Sandaracinus sp.]|nr:Na+/H+ antiporter NhaA [Sandaracinus sp.]